MNELIEKLKEALTIDCTHGVTTMTLHHSLILQIIIKQQEQIAVLQSHITPNRASCNSKVYGPASFNPQSAEERINEKILRSKLKELK